jgi:Fe-S-cluster containining protein
MSFAWLVLEHEMDFSLRQLIQKKFCLACKGCCRFKERQSLWRPKVYASEERLLKHKHFDKTFLDHQGRVATRACGDDHVCLFLDLLTNECQVYKARPFECELYPFLFIKKQEGIFLAAHLACPFIQQVQSSEQLEKYGSYLKKFFDQDVVQEFLKVHSKEISSSHICDDEIQSLCCILPQ